MSNFFIHIILSAVILDILQYGHPLLREECGPVVHINRDILAFPVSYTHLTLPTN